jgi:hypothetical protein
LKERSFSPITKSEQASALKGRSFSSITKSEQAAALKGRSFSPITKSEQAAALKGRGFSRAAMPQNQRGALAPEGMPDTHLNRIAALSKHKKAPAAGPCRWGFPLKSLSAYHHSIRRPD